jgi:hypothetical protein
MAFLLSSSSLAIICINHLTFKINIRRQRAMNKSTYLSLQDPKARCTVWLRLQPSAALPTAHMRGLPFILFIYCFLFFLCLIAAKEEQEEQREQQEGLGCAATCHGLLSPIAVPVGRDRERHLAWGTPSSSS